MKLIGLSGGPGNGKSAVADFFRKENICVIDADKIAHAIYMEKENDIISAMRQRWGEKIFDATGYINRQEVAKIIFSDREEKQFLDSLIHPEIFRRIEKILSEEKGSFAILEAALLFESSWDKKMFRTITVWADNDIRMQRLLQRNWTREHAQKRIDSQLPDDIKLEKADYAIINNGTWEALYLQCCSLLEKIRKDVEEK